jgi:diadenosine tetraphosphatase ApaH/serine/threonine PP2A family protein phosphatase
VVQEPVQEADGGGVLGKEPAPLVEGPVGADAQGTPFVGGGDEPEQQLGSGVIERGEPDFVDLCGHPHRLIYADPATMPRVLVAVLVGVVALVFFVV